MAADDFPFPEGALETVTRVPLAPPSPSPLVCSVFLIPVLDCSRLFLIQAVLYLQVQREEI